MAKDPIESIAVIPDPVNDFDQLWMVVNRENGRFVERMSLRLGGVDCGGQSDVRAESQNHLDSSVEYDDTKDIEDIVVGTQITVISELNDRTFQISNVTNNTFTLTTEV